MRISDEITSLIMEAKMSPAHVTETSNLYIDLGFDSLAFVRLLLRIEEIYSISIDLMDMATCLQTDKLIALVENKLKEAGHDQASFNESREP